MANKIGISFKINLDKIDEGKVFSGSKGRYLSVTSFIDMIELGTYGDNGMVVQETSKEERDSGILGAILGNARVFYTDDDSHPKEAQQYNNGGQAPRQQNQARQNQAPQRQNQAPQKQAVAPQAPPNNFNDFDDDIPF